ncbi:MAG: hypothetical protein QXT28_09010 [Thermofilaceae archaeon]
MAQQRRASRGSSASKRTWDIRHRYYGGAGTVFVADMLRLILEAALEDPVRALSLLKLLLSVVPPREAERAWKAMNNVKVREEVEAELLPLYADGVIDEYMMRQLVSREVAFEQLKAALDALGDWLHSALFISSSALVEVPEEEE